MGLRAEDDELADGGCPGGGRGGRWVVRLGDGVLVFAFWRHFGV